MTMERSNFYNDHKFCPTCEKYVTYLMSVELSYCVECGDRVRLFSKDDWVTFNEALKTQKPKGGRPRKRRGKESA